MFVEGARTGHPTLATHKPLPSPSLRGRDRTPPRQKRDRERARGWALDPRHPQRPPRGPLQRRRRHAVHHGVAARLNSNCASDRRGRSTDVRAGIPARSAAQATASSSPPRSSTSPNSSPGCPSTPPPLPTRAGAPPPGRGVPPPRSPGTARSIASRTAAPHPLLLGRLPEDRAHVLQPPALRHQHLHPQLAQQLSTNGRAEITPIDPTIELGSAQIRSPRRPPCSCPRRPPPGSPTPPACSRPAYAPRRRCPPTRRRSPPGESMSSTTAL